MSEATESTSPESETLENGSQTVDKAELSDNDSFTQNHDATEYKEDDLSEHSAFTNNDDDDDIHASKEADDFSDFSSGSHSGENRIPLAQRLAAKRNNKDPTNENGTTESRRNHGRSKISTGTKQYMSKYPEKSTDGILRLGNLVPDFKAETSQGPIESFHNWKKGKWAVLFSHPSDFTPVCTTEIASIAALYPELKRLDCLLIGLSVDSPESHRQWMQDIVAHYRVDDSIDDHGCDLDLDFPIIADEDRSVANLYGMIDVSNHENLTIRSVFIIDPDHKLRISLNYPASVGRNLDEILRCVKCLQLSYQKSVATPANWPRNHPKVKMPDGTISKDWKGSVFLLPTVSAEQAFLNYPGYHTCEMPSQKKYLRLVKAVHVGVDPSEIPGDIVDHDKTTRQSNATLDQDTTTNQPWTWKWPWEQEDSQQERPSQEQKQEGPWKWPWEQDPQQEKSSPQRIEEEQRKWPWEQEENPMQDGQKQEPQWKWPWEQEENPMKEGKTHEPQNKWKLPWEPQEEQQSEKPSQEQS